MQDYHVLEARYVIAHVVWLRFQDGTSGEIDLAPALRGPVFQPLLDPLVFRNFAIHPEFHTLVWPNGADFDPETLRNWPRYRDDFVAMARRWSGDSQPLTRPTPR